ncbi:hypothetical protein Hanom_Chr01g00017111 [Helianthus anomalus]
MFRVGTGFRSGSLKCFFKEIVPQGVILFGSKRFDSKRFGSERYWSKRYGWKRFELKRYASKRFASTHKQEFSHLCMLVKDYDTFSSSKHNRLVSSYEKSFQRYVCLLFLH